MSFKPVIAIVGATATGKTKLGVAVARLLHGEVVGIDSLQCYRDGGVVTGRPSEEEMGAVRHHMVGCLGPTEEPTAEEYVGQVLLALADMDRRNRTPVLVGGSMSLTLPVLEAVSRQGYRLFVLLLWPTHANESHVRRICDRVDAMVDELGLLAELAGLERLEHRLCPATGPAATAADDDGARGLRRRGVWKAIGYPELLPYLRSTGDDGDAERAGLLRRGLQAMKDNSVRYAVRQQAWAQAALVPALFRHSAPFAALWFPVQAQQWDADVARQGLRLAYDFCASLATRMAPTIKAVQAEQRVVCVFAGSQPGSSPLHMDASKALAHAFHRHNIHMVYGGGVTGIMGAIARELVSLSGPDAVHGVIPYALEQYEAGALGGPTGAAPRNGAAAYGRKTVVQDMHSRKRMMHECVARGARPGSGFVALSGGYGTAEELLEAVTWRQLGLHDRPVCVYDVAGAYAGLRAWVGHSAGQGFIPGADAGLLAWAASAAEVVDCMLRPGQKGGGHGIEWS